MISIFYTYASIAASILFIVILYFFIKYINLYSKKLYWFLFAFLCLLFIFHTLLFNTDAEDAYISYRYCENFIKGNGFVFNVNEHVEGYSNFLWIIILSAVNIITHIDVAILARIISFVFSALTIFVCFKVIHEITSNKISGLLVFLIIASSGIFACYSASGLESSLYTFFVTLYVFTIIRNRWFLNGLIIALATMTRPEGILLILSSIIFIISTKELINKNKLKILSNVAIGIAILLIPWTIWRLLYYNHFLPNSIAAKEGMSFKKELLDGFTYCLGFVTVTSPIFILLFYKIIQNNLIINKRWVFKPYNILLITIVIIYSAFYIVIGGDWMPCWRFFVPLIPVISLLCVYNFTSSDIKENNIEPLKFIVILFLICSFLTTLNSFTNSKMLEETQTWKISVKQLKIIGKWFNESLPNNIVIAAYANGAMSYFDKLPTIDIWGLTDEHIARYGNKFSGGLSGHVSYDYDYIIQKEPDIIAFMQGSGFADKPIKWDALDSLIYNKYSNITFVYDNPIVQTNKYVSFYIINTKKESIINSLLSNKNYKLYNLSN